MNNELPKWERGDTLKSIRGVADMGRIAIARVIGYIAELPERIDTKACNQINGEDDEKN